MNRSKNFVVAAMVIVAAITSAARADSALEDKERKTDSAATAVSASQTEPIATASSESTTFSLTVVNGEPSGNYPAGKLVLVTADAPPAGAKFAGWTGDVAVLANSLLPTTTATIPHMAVSITATYTPATATAPAGGSIPQFGPMWEG